MKCIQILSLSLIYPRKQYDRDSSPCYEKTTETTRPQNNRGLDGNPGIKASLDQVQPQKVLAGVALMSEWVAGDLCMAVNSPYTRAQIHSPGQDHELLGRMWGGNRVGLTVSTGHVQRDACLTQNKSTQLTANPDTSFSQLNIILLHPPDAILGIWLPELWGTFPNKELHILQTTGQCCSIPALVLSSWASHVRG